MKLDLLFEGKMEPKAAMSYNRLAKQVRPLFIELIKKASMYENDSLDWWVSGPASRNTFTSPLFHYCCCIALFTELIKDDTRKITEIVVDSYTLKKIIQQIFRKHSQTIKVVVKKHSRWWIAARKLLKILVCCLRCYQRFSYARSSNKLRKPLPKTALTLIDTFVLKKYVEKDRYYTGLWELLSEEQKASVYFVPTLYGFSFKKYTSIYSKMRRSTVNFLIKEDFLHISDYVYALGYFARIKRFKIPSVMFFGVDISPLIKEELFSLEGMYSAVQALLNYRFAYRLKQQRVRLRLVVDWFENQVIDKGWNKGFRKYYPEVESIGYVGFHATPYYLCMFPTEYEYKLNLIPSKVGVIGSELIPLIKEFCPSLDVFVAPAFRFREIWNEPSYFPEQKFYTILIALPDVLKDVEIVLTILPGKDIQLGHKKLRYWIKHHPTTTLKQVKKAYGKKWPEHFIIVNGELNQLTEQSNILISTNSSTAVETLAKGIPVIVIGNSHGLTHNPIPETITSDIWRLCYSPQEVADAIQFYQTRSPEKIKEHEEVGRRIREEYFEPVTREGVRQFLGITDKSI